MSRWLRLVGAAVAGMLVGAALTLAVQTSTRPAQGAMSERPALPAIRSVAPETFLAWIPRGLPRGFQ